MPDNIMLVFRRSLLVWVPRIKRAAYLQDVQVEDLPGGEFKLVAVWDGGRFERAFTKGYVLGRFSTKPPMQQRPCKRVCWFRDEFVKAVLSARGV